MTDLWPAECTFYIRCISIVPLYSFHQLHAPPHNILRIHHSQILPSSKFVQEVCYNTSFSIMNRWFSPEPNSSKISVPTLVIVFSSRFLSIEFSPLLNYGQQNVHFIVHVKRRLTATWNIMILGCISLVLCYSFHASSSKMAFSKFIILRFSPGNYFQEIRCNTQLQLLLIFIICKSSPGLFLLRNCNPSHSQGQDLSSVA